MYTLANATPLLTYPTHTHALSVVVILPDWSGVDEYEQTRAAMLADQGWIAFAADIYGLENHNPESFDDRRYQTGLYRSNLTLYNSRIAEAISQASMIPGADPSKGVAVIGYCVSTSGFAELFLLSKSMTTWLCMRPKCISPCVYLLSLHP